MNINLLRFPTASIKIEENHVDLKLQETFGEYALHADSQKSNLEIILQLEKEDKANLNRVSDFVIDRLNPFLDHYRSSIPSKEEMLIINLPGIKETKLLVSELEGLDTDEILTLNSDKEKNIDHLKVGHEVAHVIGVSLGLLTMTASTIIARCSKSFGFRTVTFATISVSIMSDLLLQKFVNQQEIA